MFLSACGGSSSTAAGYQTGTDTGTGTGTGNCVANGTTVTIGANHGHTPPVITAADVAAGTQKQYSLGPSNASAFPPNHTHTVTLTAATFSALHGNTAQEVITDADNTGHAHLISIGCA